VASGKEFALIAMPAKNAPSCALETGSSLSSPIATKMCKDKSSKLRIEAKEPKETNQ
jgi:hypothetical protein